MRAYTCADTPSPKINWIEPSLEENMELTKELISAALSARQAARIKLRQPVSEIIIVTEEPTVQRAAEHLNR